MEKRLDSFWKELMDKLKIPEDKRQKTYNQLIKLYSEKHRAYHNLAHIYELCLLWERDKDQLADSTLVGLVIWFHDAIYRPHRKDNELASAKLARQELSKWGLSDSLVEKVWDYIVSTQDHTPLRQEDDLLWLLDADLSILGAQADRYQAYTKQIRKEYRIYPSFLYRPGRKSILRKLLQKSRLFQTESFFARYEEQARMNVESELQQLS